MSYNIEKKITKVNKGATGANKPEWIIFHFVGASGQAQDNANYFYSVYRGASAHYFVDPNKIIQIVPDTTPAWHIGDGSRTRKGTNNGYIGKGATNNNAIGVELCQDTSTGKDVWHWDFHPETVNKALWLIKKLQKQYNIPDSRVIRHYDATGKMCPGNWQYNNWAEWWAFKKRLAGVSGGSETGNPGHTDGKPAIGVKQHLVKTGETLSGIAKKYGKTVAQLTNWNNLKNPNLILPETYLFVEKPSSSDTSGSSKPANNGLYGAKLVKNEKAKFTVTTPNGIKVRNAPSVKAKHVKSLAKGKAINYTAVYEGNGYRWLRYTEGKETLYVPYRTTENIKDQWGTFGDGKTSSKPKANLKVDGYWGVATTRALQVALGTIVDGVISKPSNVVKALQRKVGARADGYLGPETYRKLQAYLGTPVDGKLSKPSLMVKEMQRRLNNGTF